MSQVILKPRKARPFYGRHPWVLDSAIDRVEGPASDGDVVDLVSDKGKFIARGIFNGQSRIRVRLYTWHATEMLDETFWRRRLQSAIGFRGQLGYGDPRGAARLVFSEGDGLSGLIVDRYAGFLAVQVTALAMAVRLPQIAPMLAELTQAQGIMIRTERGVSRAEGLDAARRPLLGPDARRTAADRRWRSDLRVGSVRGAEDGLLSRPAGKSPGGGPLFPRPPRLGHVLLQRRVRLGGRGSRRRRRSARRRYQSKGRHAGLGECRAERPEERYVSARRRVRNPRIVGRGRPSNSAAWCSIRPSSPAAAAPSTKRCGRTIG